MAELRHQGQSADTDYAGRSLKGQLTQAGRLGARLTVIVGASWSDLRRPVPRRVRTAGRPAREDYRMSWRDLGSGEVRPEHVEQVKLAGWVARRHRDHGSLLFIDLRDQTGLCQLVVNPKRLAKAAATTTPGIRNEFVLQAEGEVAARGERQPADRSRGGPGRPPRGHLDLPAAALPADEENVDETLRLRYRWIDLRPGEGTAEHPAARADAHPARNGRRWLP